jgi:hypothetical protein
VATAAVWPPLARRSGQATRPKSEAMRVTRQLRLDTAASEESTVGPRVRQKKTAIGPKHRGTARTRMMSTKSNSNFDSHDLGTVLVVGGSGWLGSFIVRRCLRLGIEARCACARRSCGQCVSTPWSAQVHNLDIVPPRIDLASLHAVEERVCPFHQADLCKCEEVAGEQQRHRVLAIADGLRCIGCQPFSHESDLALFSIPPLSSTFARKKTPE